MPATNLAEAKALLSELVDRAIGGEPQIIMRRGKPVAKIVAIEPERKPLDISSLRALTKGQSLTSDTLTVLREKSRY